VTEKIPARFRKTKTEKWAVMAPVADLEAALAAGGKVDVQKKNGDWSTFTVGSLGGAFDVDGVQMCYGYAPGDDNPPQGSSGAGTGVRKSGPIDLREDPQNESEPNLAAAPQTDDSEPLPDYQGGPDDEWEQPF
jgi:hypothetical protein